MWLISILTLLQMASATVGCSALLSWHPLYYFSVFSILDRVFVSNEPPSHSWIFLLSPRLSSSCSSERQEDIDHEEMALLDNETPKEIGGERIQDGFSRKRGLEERAERVFL